MATLLRVRITPEGAGEEFGAGEEVCCQMLPNGLLRTVNTRNRSKHGITLGEDMWTPIIVLSDLERLLNEDV